MKIAVTGATGFVGNHVVRELLKYDDVQIVAASRNAEKAKEMPWFKEVKYVACDLQQEGIDFFTTLGRPEVLIHLAWQGLPNFNERFHFEKNLPSDYQFLKQMIEAGLQRLTVSGTCFEYGLQEGCLDEETATQPCTCYGRAKNTLHQMLELLLSKHTKTVLCWARLFYLHGEGQSEKSFHPLLSAAIARGDAVFNMSGGEQLRDYLPIAEAAAKLVQISLNREAAGTYNICSGSPSSMRSIAEEIIKESGAAIELNLGCYPYPDYEPMEFWGSCQKYASLKSGTLRQF